MPAAGIPSRPAAQASATLIGITGATGFVGGWLAQSLLHQGHHVRLLVRSDAARLPQPIRQQVDITVGDLHNAEALLSFTRDCDAVVHCAASVRGNSWHDFASANVNGTENLLGAMQSQGCNYLLHISSLAATQPQLSWYSRSKHLAETLIVDSGMPALMLRPPAIYGPGDRELKPLLDMLYRGGVALRVTAPQQRLALLHVADLCSAISAALAVRPQGCYAIDDGNAQGYDWDDLRLAMQRLSGRRVRSVQLPAPMLHALAHLNLHWSRLRRRGSMLNPGKARELRWADWRANEPTLQQALDWQPNYPLEAGLLTIYGTCKSASAADTNTTG